MQITNITNNTTEEYINVHHLPLGSIVKASVKAYMYKKKIEFKVTIKEPNKKGKQVLQNFKNNKKCYICLPSPKPSI